MPKTDTGPGRLPNRKKQYTVYQSMSAQEIEASDLNQVPALHLRRGGAENVYHGLHLLLDSGRMTCPWPLSFFLANDRTAFSIHMERDRFPIDIKPGSDPDVRTKDGSLSVRFDSAHPAERKKRKVTLHARSGDMNENRPTLASSELSEGNWIKNSTVQALKGNSGFTVDEVTRSKVFLTLVDGQPEEVRVDHLSEVSSTAAQPRPKRKSRQKDTNRNMCTENDDTTEAEQEEESDVGSGETVKSEGNDKGKGKSQKGPPVAPPSPAGNPPAPDVRNVTLPPALSLSLSTTPPRHPTPTT